MGEVEEAFEASEAARAEAGDDDDPAARAIQHLEHGCAWGALRLARTIRNACCIDVAVDADIDARFASWERQLDQLRAEVRKLQARQLSGGEPDGFVGLNAAAHDIGRTAMS